MRLREAFDNIKNKEIANKIGVSEAAVTKYMQGRIPRTQVLVKILELTKVNLEWLLLGVGSKYRTGNNNTIDVQKISQYVEEEKSKLVSQPLTVDDLIEEKIKQTVEPLREQVEGLQREVKHLKKKLRE